MPLTDEPMPKYDNASGEPLEIIEANECHGYSGYADLATRRFRALFNALETYAENERLACARAVCPKRCGKGAIPHRDELSGLWFHHFENVYGENIQIVCPAAAIWERLKGD